MLVGVAADRHHVVKLDGEQLVDVLGAVLGDVHAGLGHHLHGERVESMGFDPRRVGLDLVALEVPSPALSHLAAAGISRAEEEDFQSVAHGHRNPTGRSTIDGRSLPWGNNRPTP